jgi:DNA topoisomerase I
MTITAEPTTAARPQASDVGAAQYLERLVRSDPAAGGIRRRRCGRGFRYLDASGPVTDPEILARIKALVIPPAWDDVWICADPLGHIQATGTDAAGRRQYRYHDLWRQQRDRAKHDRVLGFGAARRRGLPRISLAMRGERQGLGGSAASHDDRKRGEAHEQRTRR